MFLLDIRYDPKTKMITKWIKDGDDCKPVREIYFPKIYVSGNIDLQFFDKVPGIRDICFEEKSIALGKKPEKVMCIKIDPIFIYDIRSLLESQGYSLYNGNISTVRQYLLEKKLFPTARLKDNNTLEYDDQYSLDYKVNFSYKELIIIPKYEGLFTIDDPIAKIYFGDSIIEGSEQYMIDILQYEITRSDPDIIFTNNGDSFEFPYLLYRASLYNIKLFLGRDRRDVKDKDINSGNGRSYFSYGKIYYKQRGYHLSGRLHIDRSSFLFREGGLSGLIDVSRITGVPLQELSRMSPGSAVNALQANLALKDNVLVSWKRNNPESENARHIESDIESNIASNKGGLILDPKIGLHMNVTELDYVSMFPNIMVNHNISPETVLCDCCLNGPKVPFINYNICSQHIGFIPRVLRPLIDRRLTYKKRAKDANQFNLFNYEEYDKRQKIIKWLLVTSFGYMGFDKANFGSLKGYESITAYARDILLRTIQISKNNGYEVYHGIIDCVWIRGTSLSCPDIKKLCEIITKDTGIDIELKGFYYWIVFLPNKTDKHGSPYRYYGLMDNGELKIRGIEMRQGSTPIAIRNLQRQMLNKLAEAKTASEFYSRIPETIIILKEYVQEILNGECCLFDLIFEIRISKSINEYKIFNNSVAIMRQYIDNGIDILPGQSVRYIVTDSKSTNYQKRVIIPELINNDTKYDKEQYYKYFLRAAESILLPFGYSVQYLDEIVKNKIQTKLYNYESM